MSESQHIAAGSRHISPSIRFVDQFLSQGPSGRLTGLLLGHLDAFNRISTTFGQEKSEAFCADYAQSLRNHLPPSTPVIRLSERRFAVLITLDSMSAVMDIAISIADGQQPQLQIGNDTFLVDVTVGIAVYPTHANDASTLFRRAELALKEARENELSFDVYRPDATQQQAALWKFESDLEQAVKDGELEAYYQPKLLIADSRIGGCEALVRWRTQSGRLISPDEFIPLAERSGSIIAITWLVFDCVARDAATWSNVHEPFSVAVNISPQVLDSFEFFGRLGELKSLLDEQNIDLILELTEDSLIKGGDELPEKLQRIRKMGVDLAIDDFGKGYSSLTYLKEIPATEVKVDKRFVGTIATDEKDRHIVKAIIDLAHTFGMKVVAEGVDSEESFRAVTKLGCGMLQGFLIARPMRSDLFLEWMESHSLDTYSGLLDPKHLRLMSSEG